MLIRVHFFIPFSGRLILLIYLTFCYSVFTFLVELVSHIFRFSLTEVIIAHTYIDRQYNQDVVG